MHLAETMAEKGGMVAETKTCHAQLLLARLPRYVDMERGDRRPGGALLVRRRSNNTPNPGGNITRGVVSSSYHLRVC